MNLHDLAEVVVEAEIFPKILTCLKDVDVYVRKNAATVIREIVKHTPELAQLVVSSGGVGAIVDYVNEAKGNNRLPGVMTLGYISAFSETLALAVIVAKGIPPLVNCLVHEPEDHIKAAIRVFEITTYEKFIVIEADSLHPSGYDYTPGKTK